MATQTLATADALLKDVYRGPIINQVNRRTYMLDQIERDSEAVTADGKRAIVAINASPNLSSTSISDGGTLPTPGAQGYADAIITIRYHSAGLALTDQLIEQADTNEGAFVNVLQNDTKKLADDLKKTINRQVFGDGTGVLATLTSSPAGTNSFTVDSVQYLQVGLPIDILTKSNGAGTAVSLTITAINRTTKTVTVSANVTQTATTDGLYKPGARGNEMDGLRNITGTARTLHSIDSSVAGNEYWNGNRRTVSGAIAGETVYSQLAEDIDASGDGGDPDAFIASPGVRRRLAETYQSNKQFNDAKAVEIHGGYSVIYVNEIPVHKDQDAPKGWAFGLKKAAFLWYQTGEPDWLDRSGSIWHLASGSTAGSKKAVWEAWFKWYAALGCVRPGSTGAIPDAQDD